jgi:uncharacterized membrane protein YdfJ with MMPL/SSD domain
LQNLLGFQAIRSLDSTQIILIFALAFSLSMDYEVFLLSRIREQFDSTGNNREAVARGLQRTSWLITSAALLLAVMVGAFATSKIIFIVSGYRCCCRSDSRELVPLSDRID